MCLLSALGGNDLLLPAELLGAVLVRVSPTSAAPRRHWCPLTAFGIFDIPFPAVRLPYFEAAEFVMTLFDGKAAA